MTFDHEKRSALGWLALLAPLPLPLNVVLEWPVLFVYAVAVIVFLRRLEERRRIGMPVWLLNVLGLLYLPILFFDLSFQIGRDRLITAILHLILFLVVVKLFSACKEKEKWHLFIAIFFLFVAAMATSSHPSVVLYLLVMMVAGLRVLARFAQLHTTGNHRAESGASSPGSSSLPSMRLATALALLVLVALAVPIFTALPRFSKPFVMGRGGALGASTTTGFTDEVDLSLTSEIRANRQIALRIDLGDLPINADNLRFKGAAYDVYRDRRWNRLDFVRRPLSRDQRRQIKISDRPPIGSARITLEPLRSQSLIVPSSTVAVRAQQTLGGVVLDGGGALSSPLLIGRREPIDYVVELAAEPVIEALPESPDLAENPDPAEAEAEAGAGDEIEDRGSLDLTGVTSEIRQLAASVMATGDHAERIERVERHLLTNYDYTLDFVGREGQAPIHDFLFEYQSGHCEYFATAMVLMLRSQGIPARFVTGFLGAEYNGIEGNHLVRQQNAHAWVEAYSPRFGWRIYDPTPPSGRPVLAEQNWRLYTEQVWDYVEQRWDRWVLSYGAADQEGLLRSLRQQLAEWWQGWWADDQEPETEDIAADVPIAGFEAPTVEQRGRWASRATRLGGLLLFVVGAIAIALLLWRRRQLSAIDAYQRLRREAVGLEPSIDCSTAPLELERRIGERLPQSRAEISQLVHLYLESSFGERQLSRAQQQQLAAALRAVIEAAKSEHRQQRRDARRHAKRAA